MEQTYTMPVTGTHIWYYYICKREVWLIIHNIAADQDDESLDIGRFLSEHTYQRHKKEMLIGDNKVDRMHKEGSNLIISEIKKSSRFKESSRYQLLYYLQTLKKMGIQAKGELLFPEEKRKETVELTPETEEELDKAVRDIRAIAKLPVPPPPKKIKFCAKCAYREYCWAEE